MEEDDKEGSTNMKWNMKERKREGEEKRQNKKSTVNDRREEL
jgi:hypothetical protein